MNSWKLTIYLETSNSIHFSLLLQFEKCSVPTVFPQVWVATHWWVAGRFWVGPETWTFWVDDCRTRSIVILLVRSSSWNNMDIPRIPGFARIHTGDKKKVCSSISDTEKGTMCRVPEEVPKKCVTSQKVRKYNRNEIPSTTVTGGKFTCKACELAYSRLSDLRYHVIRSHLKQKFIRCPHCPETFMYHSQRKEHISSTHSKEKPDKFACAHCDRQFKRKNTLAEHMMDVHIEKKCRHCNLRFVRKKYLFHLNEKHGVSMPTCGVCGLRTLMQSSLVRHQRNVHLNEKNKKCQLCSKMFYTQSNLQDHMITHKQNKIFRCDVCAKTFARRECLKTHCRIHTGEKPFSCSFCAVSFVQRARLRFHIRSHHSGSIQSNK
ncbi:hypothetical protein ABMA27_012800 [Loxostege sticticalis]|uniref:C2H2-type domain-containing protein n=1 Tax=Loxostege sticticalis TaxID=481309 RepID=A0ABR3GZU5_LOXSC